jgi:hypothetical protein
MADINKSTLLKMSTFNCRGFNSTKCSYIASVMSKCNIMFLLECWLSDMQLNALKCISESVSFHTISGFDNIEILAGRPYGGCAILYQSASIFDASPINVISHRVCAARVCFESTNYCLLTYICLMRTRMKILMNLLTF